MDRELSDRLDNAYEQGVKDGRKEMLAEIERAHQLDDFEQLSMAALLAENDKLRAEIERLRIDNYQLAANSSGWLD